jgi:predicted ATPase with chaperone activity
VKSAIRNSGFEFPPHGALPIAAAAVRDGVRRMLLPQANAGEAAIVAGLSVLFDADTAHDEFD